MEHDPRIPILDMIDMEILMHRDAHFGGNFPIMIDYYEKEGVGVMPDFEIEKMQYLMHVEEELNMDLAKELLPTPARQKIESCRELYRELRSVCERPNSPRGARLMAEMILSESEDPKEEITAIARLKEEAFQPLIDLLTSSTFDDPLSPGYGRGPALAALCLKKLGDPRAIPFLFETFGRHDFACDEAIIAALLTFEEKSQEFLVKRLMHKPLNKENENAACILTHFSEDAVVAHLSLELLEQEDVQKHTTLATYLVFICTALNTPEERTRFIKLLDSPLFDADIKYEINSIKKLWFK